MYPYVYILVYHCNCITVWKVTVKVTEVFSVLQSLRHSLITPLSPVLELQSPNRPTAATIPLYFYVAVILCLDACSQLARRQQLQQNKLQKKHQKQQQKQKHQKHQEQQKLLTTADYYKLLLTTTYHY